MYLCFCLLAAVPVVPTGPQKAAPVSRTSGQGATKWILQDFTWCDLALWVRSGRIVALGGRAGPVLKADKVEM